MRQPKETRHQREADPHNDPVVQRCGKRKRFRQTLVWAMDDDEVAGTRAVADLINVVRGCGDFLHGSQTP